MCIAGLACVLLISNDYMIALHGLLLAALLFKLTVFLVNIVLKVAIVAFSARKRDAKC